ncbi:hypothetical protein F25303_9806 [Fusarium sp. NRRL 25303]|nr:hypothetical protein F25303_9806 [Fusarium sp. NRRL 25303]
MSFTVSCDTEVLNDNILSIFVTCFDKMSISTLECLHGTISGIDHLAEAGELLHAEGPFLIIFVFNTEIPMVTVQPRRLKISHDMGGYSLQVEDEAVEDAEEFGRESLQDLVRGSARLKRVLALFAKGVLPSSIFKRRVFP